uniref:Glutathione peroxidase 1 n=1 Tax=Ailuropoda melanoleuca TaxID=9646 RepID=A0A7N5JCK4_AILME
MAAARSSLAGVTARPLGASEVRPLEALEPVDLGSLQGKENATNEEILKSLKYVRPGNGYEPNFTVFEKCEVNGENAHPLFKLLKAALPFPHDDPVSLMTDPKFIIWSPVCRSDIAWNFEKFLIGRDGVPFKRYSRKFETIKMQDDIEKLLQQTI